VIIKESKWVSTPLSLGIQLKSCTAYSFCSSIRISWSPNKGKQKRRHRQCQSLCPLPLHIQSFSAREEEAKSEREHGGEAANSDSQSEAGQSGIGGKNLASFCLCEPSLFK